MPRPPLAAVPSVPTHDYRKLLAAILDELRELRSDLAAQRSPHREDDSASIERLLEATESAFPGECFMTAELVTRASHLDAELLTALEATVGRLGPGTAKKLGHLLGRSSRSVSRAGKRVAKIGKTAGGTLWAVHSSKE